MSDTSLRSSRFLASLKNLFIYAGVIMSAQKIWNFFSIMSQDTLVSGVHGSPLLYSAVSTYSLPLALTTIDPPLLVVLSVSLGHVMALLTWLATYWLMWPGQVLTVPLGYS